jgi:hypothetical protein
MKRIEFMIAVSVSVFALMAGAAAQSDSLGDYARAARKEKRPPAKKMYSNDSLPNSGCISVVGGASAANSEQAEHDQAAAPTAEEQKPKSSDTQKAKAQKAEAAEKKEPQDEQEWREEISAQKKKIADLEHELDVTQREYKLLVADYYADAGTQLRDQKKFGDEEVRYRADMADKQKQIDEAKSRLQDMEEEARKAGMPSSVAE